MAKIPESYNVGDRKNLTVESLLGMLQDMYKDLAIAVNKKPDVFLRTTDGLSTDTKLADGSVNINTNTLKVEMLTEHPTSTTVTWTKIS